MIVAAMLPRSWEKKVVDMTMTKLRDDNIRRVNYMFLPAMAIQKESASRVIDRCKKLGAKVVAGFLFTAMPEYFLDVDLIMIFLF